MATISATQEARRGFYTYTWTAVTSGDTAAPVEVGGDFCAIYIGGTFDSATVVLKGAIDSSHYIALTDPQGNAISKTSEATEQVEERVRYVQPTHSGGSGSQSLNITLFSLKRGPW